MISQAVILAGGSGTRLKPFTDTAPKPMFPFEGKPFLEYLINQIKNFGITDILLLLGYMPEVIINYFGDGSNLGVNINYDTTPVDYKTGKRLKTASSKLNDNFLLLYCDNYCPIDFVKALNQFEGNKPLIQITCYSNKDCYTKNNLKVGGDFLVKKYDKSRKLDDLQGVDIGYAFVNKNSLDLLPDENINFEAEIYPKLVEQKKLGVFLTDHRYYSVGSYERIELTKEFFRPKKVAFLDRDGTINHRAAKAQYIEKPEQFEWLEGAQSAISILKQKGYITILITNQPGIARGMVTLKDLESIHEKIQSDLKNSRFDKIYFCPHGWYDNCDCRKPKAGMLYQAARDFSLDLTKCILIGDDERDITAGKTAGCICYMVDESHDLLSIVKNLEDTWE